MEIFYENLHVVTVHYANKEIAGFPLNILFTFLSVWQLSFGISNKATAVLFTFLRHFLQLISACGKLINDTMLNYPQSYTTAQKMIDFKCPSFEQFVTCPKCDAVYSFSDCVINNSGQEMSAACRHVEYPYQTYAHFQESKFVERKSSHLRERTRQDTS